MKLRVLDLFSGIGGFSLGLERTGGFETVAFCEIDPFCRRVLAKHWPEVPCYHDIRDLTAERLAADGVAVDAICGGFPCQDLSNAGKRAGLDGERSGLWREIARLSGELRPSVLILENVSALLGRGLGRVLGDLASLGYDAEWHCIPASYVGAPHQRDRIWIVAHPRGKQHQGQGDALWGPSAARFSEAVANAVCVNGKGKQPGVTDEKGRQGQVEGSPGPCGDGPGWWPTEPDVGRVAHGVPNRSHRLRALGNAVVPQIPELIGRAILSARAA